MKPVLISAALSLIASSAWAQEASNPTALGQFQSDGTTTIVQNGVATSATVVLKGTVQGTHPNLKLRVEVRLNGDAFTGVFTHQAPGYTAPGTVSSVTVAGLTPGQSYKWQAQTYPS